MTRTASICAASTSRFGSIRRPLTSTALLAWLAIFAAASAEAKDPAQRQPAQQASASTATQPAQQASASIATQPAPQPSVAQSPTAAVDELGILILRGDGGDPKELRPDAFDNLVYVARRNGESRAYRYGREIEVNALVKESAAQILAAQFGAPARGELAISGLPVSAQYALRQFVPSNIMPRIVFAHFASRADTAQVSDKMAGKLLALEASANGHADLVALVKTAMQMFGLKSDACDNSPDERCNEAGVREAFAQIKREEAQQRTASRF
jgi:hypothetical protein